MSSTGLRIGIVGPIPPPSGGMAMQTRQLVSLLKSENIEVHLLATNAPYRPAFIERVKGIRAIFRLLPYLWGAWRLAGKVDVIHIMANSGWSWQLFCAPVVWLGWLRNTPVIINYRGGEAFSYFQKSFQWVKPTIDKAFAVVVPSGFLHKVFDDFGVESKIIPNIINLDRFFPGEYGSEGDDFSVVITRNLEPIYGIDTAIKAVGLLVDKFPRLRLKIAGSGPLLSELESLVLELGLDSKVQFVGRLGPDEVPLFYRSAQLMLNPATIDNMPNSVLEALASGVPVVSTDVGGVPYIVKDEYSALLVRAGDEQQMAAAIERLYLDDCLRARLITCGMKRLDQYAWPQVKDQWLDVYASAASRGAL